MPDNPDSNKSPDNRPDQPSWVAIPQYKNDWDRLLNVYNIQELPSLPADVDTGSEDTPLSIKVMREFFLDAANAFALEIWFDFAPEVPEAIDVCFSPHCGRRLAVR